MIDKYINGRKEQRATNATSIESLWEVKLLSTIFVCSQSGYHPSEDATKIQIIPRKI
jgi:hypothetical protein